MELVRGAGRDTDASSPADRRPRLPGLCCCCRTTSGRSPVVCRRHSQAIDKVARAPGIDKVGSSLEAFYVRSYAFPPRKLYEVHAHR